MDASSEPEPKRIERVVLACINCRSRHVKCDATQPICNRCKRDGKECDYQKSRRGGLDKAALARRKLRLRQEAEQTQKDADQEQVESEQLASLELGIRSTNSSQPDNRAFLGNTIAVPITGTQYSDRSPAFQFDAVRENLLSTLGEII
jgi:hypothetical protein